MKASGRAKKCGFLVGVMVIFSVSMLFANEPLQNATTEVLDSETAEDTSSVSSADYPSLKNHAPFVGFGPMLLVNTDSSKNSAPSPVMFSLGGGATFFQNAVVSFQPRLTFFTNYYLWDGEAAHPAEVENRTATVLSFLLDVDAVKIFRHGKNVFQVGGGVSVLARVSILAGGVNSDDEGGTDASTAGDDVSSIGDYFWADMRFLYPNVAFCWLHELPNGWYAGASANVYVPLGSLMNGDGVDGMLFSLGLRVAF